MSEYSDIGLIGLGVMGQSLALNFAGKGFTVSAWDTQETSRSAFSSRTKSASVEICDTIEVLVSSLTSPRKVMLMVPAGNTVDKVIGNLLPLLDEGDIIIDGGNSHFSDTDRRNATLAESRIQFIGAGISGGEEGALNGPAIMPGGNSEGWPAVKPLLEAIAAKSNGETCCSWIGPGGAGHFVKMVHNGIEYGDMQLICEAYHLMRDLLGLSQEEMHDVFTGWDNGPLASYLVEITANILAFKDKEDYLLDRILDVAGQKGTGTWASNTALAMGVPLTLIGEAVFARSLSARKEERVAASRLLAGPAMKYSGDKSIFLAQLEQALLSAKIVSYAQGFDLLKAASEKFNWELNYSAIAKLWRAGCIIRSSFLDDIAESFTKNTSLSNLMLDDHFKTTIANNQSGWRGVIAICVAHGIPCPALAAALNYYDGYRTEHLPANLLQAQRDYFGAHTFERTDKQRGEFFHADWSEKKS